MRMEKTARKIKYVTFYENMKYILLLNIDMNQNWLQNVPNDVLREQGCTNNILPCYHRINIVTNWNQMFVLAKENLKIGYR